MLVIEGTALLEQAIAAGWLVESVYVPANAAAPDVDAPVHLLAPNVIERVATTESPRPLLAVVHQRRLDVPTAPTFVLVAHQLGDPGNAGTIIRSAEAAGAEAVVLTPGSVDATNPKVVRASAGSLFRIAVVEQTLEQVAALGVRVLGTSSHRGAAYTDVDLRGPLAVVVGNEAHGLPEDAPVDEWITIPHGGPAESLNVAMAATVLAFEVARQRRAS